MSSLIRNAGCTLVLMVLLALGMPAQRAQAVEASDNSPPLTLTVMPGPIGKDALPAPLAEPVLLCGDRWVTGTYILGSNCYKACINRGLSPGQCTGGAWVGRCRACWYRLTECARAGWTPINCRRCSARYAECMRGLL